MLVQEATLVHYIAAPPVLGGVGVACHALRHMIESQVSHRPYYKPFQSQVASKLLFEMLLGAESIGGLTCPNHKV